MHQQSINSIGSIPPKFTITTLSYFMMFHLLDSQTATRLAPKIVIPKRIKQSQSNALATAPYSQVHEQRIIRVYLDCHLCIYYMVFLITLLEVSLHYGMQQVYCYYVEEGEYYLAYGLVDSVVELHQVGEDGGVSVGVALVGGGVEGGIGVYFVVDVGQLQVVMVNVFVERKEENQGHSEEEGQECRFGPMCRLFHHYIQQILTK